MRALLRRGVHNLILLPLLVFVGGTVCLLVAAAFGTDIEAGGDAGPFDAALIGSMVLAWLLLFLCLSTLPLLWFTSGLVASRTSPGRARAATILLGPLGVLGIVFFPEAPIDDPEDFVPWAGIGCVYGATMRMRDQEGSWRFVLIAVLVLAAGAVAAALIHSTA